MVHRSDQNPVRAENLQSSMMPQFSDSFRAPSLLRLVLIWFLPEAALGQKSIDLLPLRGQLLLAESYVRFIYWG